MQEWVVILDRTATFEAFFNLVRLDSVETYQNGLEGIARALNKSYYDCSDPLEHLILAGSVGRGTAVSGASDVDAIFELPSSVYKRFDDYESNGQSALLQEVKNAISVRYPRTKMKADGQVIVVDFTERNYSIELVPAFRQDDNSFLFPDTHDGGSWKKTDPLSEQDESTRINKKTSGSYVRYCNALRVWRDTQGFPFGGLLIDTLVYNNLNKGELSEAALADDYVEGLKALFAQLSSENRDQAYWLALGSNQQVKNKDGGVFVKKAKKALRALDSSVAEVELEDALCDLFGKRFRDSLVSSESKSQERKWIARYGCNSNEQFIEAMYPVDVRYELELDCKVTQDGFRPQSLKEILCGHGFLRKQKKLEFYIDRTNAPQNCQVYWKVRNCGEEAYRRNMIRGKICKDSGHRSRSETTDFTGPHFVECYCVLNGVCVARARIDVPIRA